MKTKTIFLHASIEQCFKICFHKFNFCSFLSDHEDGKKQKRGEEGLKGNNSETGRQDYQAIEGEEGRGKEEYIKKEPDPDPEPEQEQEPESSSEEEEEPPTPYDKVPGEAPLNIEISC